MIELTKCEGGNCPVRDTCYRFIAEDENENEIQMYFIDPPYAYDGCMEYWELKQND